MATTNYTSLLGLALPTSGDLSGTWGDEVNNAITSLLDGAVAGSAAITADADVTLTTTNGAANQARQAVLLCTGARTAVRTITAPARSKTYVVINATTGGFAVKFVGAGPTTGVTIPAGSIWHALWDGTDFTTVNYGITPLISVSGTDTIAASSPARLTSYPDGQVFSFIASGTNTGAATLNISSLGAVPVRKSGGLVLDAGDITTGSFVLVKYVAATGFFELISGGGGGAKANGVIYENNLTVTANYTIPNNKGAHSVGPITVNNGVVVTVGSGSRWVIS